MLNQIDIAIHASSLWDGMVYGRNFDDILKKWDQGCYELHCALVEIAIKDAELCDALYEACGKDFPGMYTYVVTEELGSVIGDSLLDSGEVPCAKVIERHLRSLVESFYSESGEKLSDAILDTLLPGSVEEEA